jgi:hypothetical protein
MSRNPKQSADVGQEFFSEAYWRRHEPEPTDRGSQSGENIFNSVGYALSEWEVMEEAFADLFMVMTEIVSAGSYVTVRRVYGEVEQSAGRRTALRTAGEIFFVRHANLERTQLGRLLTAFERAASRRDDIAHGKALSFTVNGTDMGYFLVPAGYNLRRNAAFTGLSGTNLEDDPLWFMPGRYRYAESAILAYADKNSRISAKEFGNINRLSLRRLVWKSD